jgi:dolichol kinase
LAAVELWQAATARSEEAWMATRPDNGGQATRKQGNGLAVATLVFGVVGLILGVLSPPALLLGLVAVVLGAGTLGQGRERLSPVGLGMTVAGLLAGLVCLVLTLLFLTGFFES